MCKALLSLVSGPRIRKSPSPPGVAGKRTWLSGVCECCVMVTVVPGPGVGGRPKIALLSFLAAGDQSLSLSLSISCV